MSRGGLSGWSNDEVVSTYFKTSEETADVTITLDGKLNGISKLFVKFAGETKTVTISGSAPYSIGTFTVDDPGYQKLELRGIERSGNTYIDLTNVLVKGAGTINFIPEGDTNSIHWGRRGSSGHVWHEGTKKVKNIDYFYSELTVPEGTDTLGSYFMAAGFNKGYFGMQINSETERRILFSVWSPYKTDHPTEIPEDERV